MANLTFVEMGIYPSKLTNSIAYPTSSHLPKYICKVRTIHTCLNITYITHSDYIPYRTWIYQDLETKTCSKFACISTSVRIERTMKDAKRSLLFGMDFLPFLINVQDLPGSHIKWTGKLSYLNIKLSIPQSQKRFIQSNSREMQLVLIFLFGRFLFFDKLPPFS